MADARSAARPAPMPHKRCVGIFLYQLIPLGS
jgi:hypothetical protein